MFGAIAGGIASALAGGAMSKLFGGGQKAASGGIQGDVLATDNNTVGMGDAGITSAIQGSNVPNPDEAVPSFVSGAMAKAGKGLLEGTLQAKQKESTARVASIMENTNLSKQQQVSEIMRQMLTQAQTAGQYFTNDQIKEMTRKVSAEVDLVHQQTQNQRYGSSHIGATAKDISNVVTDAASGVVDIFHGIDKA